VAARYEAASVRDAPPPSKSWSGMAGGMQGTDSIEQIAPRRPAVS
jgi:hypothetical protein